jgi:hypothetical protein
MHENCEFKWGVSSGEGYFTGDWTSVMWCMLTDLVTGKQYATQGFQLDDLSHAEEYLRNLVYGWNTVELEAVT